MNNKDYLAYSVGALLYTPALNEKIAIDIVEEKFYTPYSLAFCLEDTISENSVYTALDTLLNNFKIIYENRENKNFFIPKMFVRVRYPEQIGVVYKLVKQYQSLLTGFILPKYSINNCEEYNKQIVSVNNISKNKLYMMPILENKGLLNIFERRNQLKLIKNSIDCVKDYTLNIRVGGNDFCNHYAIRRGCDETIYDVRVVADALVDILSVFSDEYVVSGAVWEYFKDEEDLWKKGLIKELKLDKLNGFIGKTVIHPNQIKVVNQMLMVSKKDYDDAKMIVDWKDNGLLVNKGDAGERMNEIKTHTKWALKILKLAKIYGVENNKYDK